MSRLHCAICAERDEGVHSAAVARVVQDKSTETLTAAEGSDLTLECAAEGFPVPQINWQKYGGQLPVGRYSIVLGLSALQPNNHLLSVPLL